MKRSSQKSTWNRSLGKRKKTFCIHYNGRGLNTYQVPSWLDCVSSHYTEGFPEPPGLRRRQAWLIFIIPSWQISVGFWSGLVSRLNFPSCCRFLRTVSPFLVREQRWFWGEPSVLGCCTAPLRPQAPLLPSPSFRGGFLEGTALHLTAVGRKAGCCILGNCSGLLPFMIPRY